MKRNIANIITAIRIPLSLVLLLIAFGSPLFISIYIIIGLTDMVDGYIARKLKATSTFGAKLDSFSDFIFFSVVAIIIIPKLELSQLMINLALVIIFVRVISFVILYIKHKKIIMHHTILNKITGGLLFIYPLLMINSLEIAIVIFGMLAAIDELVIIIKFKSIELDRKSCL